MTKTRMIVAGAVAATVILAAGGWAVFGDSGPNIDPSRLAAVERGDVAKSVVATGRVEPVSKVEIKSKANGIVKDLKVDVGAGVRVGQVLAELDKDNLEARARESRAALAGAQANLTAAQAELEKNKVEAEGPDVPFARRSLERAEQLSREKLIAPQGLDDARSALEQAANRQLAARTQLGVAQARVAQARAAVAAAQAAVERAEEELANATIRSPIDGVVLSRPVELGSPVSSILNLGANATLVMVLGDISQVYVKGNVDEADIGAVRLGQPARIKVETFRDKQFDGKVTQISPMGTDKDNVISFEVRVSIDNAGGELLANMTANAEIILEMHTATLVIPEAAIVYDAQRKASVDVVSAASKTGRERKTITVGVSNGTRTQVVSGLTEGQKVVLQ
ncbi:MAG: efflux RND transporter periplasmic adaptor subunit [Vicinamibacterales bacterium]|nr:efflux RND transporter periplasmic adaptor subunit [Vicinamibacterales bacterium]